MSTRIKTESPEKSEPIFSAAQNQILQRKCACGQHTIGGGECAACAKGREGSTRKPVEEAAPAASALKAPAFHQDFSSVSARNAARPFLQAKRQVSQPSDRFEQEADRAADQLIRTPSLNTGADKSPELTPTGSSDALNGSSTVESDVRNAMGSGVSLPEATRALFEPRLRIDLGLVRVHTGERAAQSAHELNAKAYTVGNDMVFASGQFSPATSEGQKLLAHELAHVAQQRGAGQKLVSCQAVESYETKGVALDPAETARLAAASYWVQLVGSAYSLNFLNKVPDRFKNDAEERDAALSALWQVRPKEVKSEEKRLVTIPARAEAKSSKTVLYEFTFTPKDESQKQTKDNVNVDFIAEGGAAAVAAAPAPSASYTPSTFSRGGSDFPNGIDDYFKKHPEEEKQLYNWIENVAGQSFDQVVTTKSETKQGAKTVPHDTSYMVKGMKDKAGKITSLEIRFLGEVPTASHTPLADYRKKDQSDLLIEQAQTVIDPKKKERLGTITGLEKVPADERTSVNDAVLEYFKNDSRNTEVDALVPIANTTRIVLYTLRYRTKAGAKAADPKVIDVEVERIGEEGKEIKIGRSKLDVARSPEFVDNSKDAAKLKTWLGTRYKGITPSGASVDDIRASANAEIEKNADKPDFFKTNYGIVILDEKEGAERLKKTHKYLDGQVDNNMKTFGSDELKTLETSLETMSSPLLSMLKGTQIVRQKKSIVQEVGKDKKITLTPTDDYGLALGAGAEKTVIIFDRFNLNAGTLFMGGKSGVLRSEAMTFAHELGHHIGFQADIEKKFNEKFINVGKPKTPTWYAASKPGKESFPEAYALFHGDPEWMKVNLPEMHSWFEELMKTGKPPAK